MTTKHVVADDIFGSINRKEWELNRRVLEGTLDAKTVLSRLQSIIEDSPYGFPIENQRHFKLSDKVYDVTLPAKTFKSVYDYARTSRYFSRNDIDQFSQPRISNALKAKVRLGQVTQEMSVNLLRYELGLAGIKPASTWELVAFIGQSAVTRIWTRGACYVSIAPNGVITWKDSGNKEEAFTKVRMMEASPAYSPSRKLEGWWIDESKIYENSLVHATDYFLVLASVR